MTASVSKDSLSEWKVFQSGDRGVCRYENVPGTTVSIVDFTQGPNSLPPGFGSLDQLLDELQADPELQEGFAAARRDLGIEELAPAQVSIGALRALRGLSQGEFAQLLGTSQAAISRIESGRQAPGLKMLRKMVHFLGIDFNTLDRALP